MIRLVFLLVFCGSAWSKSPPQSVLLYNETTGHHLIETNPDTVRSIASITKVMTAMVALDYDTNLDRPLKLVGKTRGVLPRGTWTRGEVLQAMLVRSDNDAAETLAADYPGGRKAFLAAMNLKADVLGMPHANFSDASGLDNRNVTTLIGVKRLLLASAEYPLIRSISVQKQALFEQRFKKRIRQIELPNTNKELLFKFDSIVVSKTGLTTPAGWCVGMVVEQQGQRYVVIILGARNKLERLKIAKEIMYNNLSDTDLR
jgi:D-alanyl-D-alanine endopeptidase (penicillin-binding protein 7)